MLVGLLGLGAGAGLSLGRLRARPADPIIKTLTSPFAPDRRRALAAATERVLPGAVEAGVPDYIDYWMRREPFASHVEPLFRIGAVHLDRLARAAHDKPFAACRPQQQDAILRRFQQGAVRAKRFHSNTFFEHLVRFTIEGFLADPSYGGNRDRVGWKFIGHPDGHPGCWWEPRQLDIHLGRMGGLPW